MIHRDAVESYIHGRPEFKGETGAGDTLPGISAHRWHLNCETRWKSFLKTSGAITEQRGTLVFGGQEFKEKTTEGANNQAVEWGDPRENVDLTAKWRPSFEKGTMECVNCCWDVSKMSTSKWPFILAYWRWSHFDSVEGTDIWLKLFMEFQGPL